MRLGSAILLRALIASTLGSYSAAMAIKVSPGWMVYSTRAPGDAAGVAVGAAVRAAAGLGGGEARGVTIDRGAGLAVPGGGRSPVSGLSARSIRSTCVAS